MIWGYALFFHGIRAAGTWRTVLLVGAGQKPRDVDERDDRYVEAVAEPDKARRLE